MSVLAIDIGGTFIKHALMDRDTEILSSGKTPTPQSSREELIETIGGIYDSQKDVEGIGISMPGIIDSEKGYCHSGGALLYNAGCYFAEEVMKRCPVPVTIENDAKCAVLAESASGSLAGAASGFALIFGTGIGGGFVKDGKLHKGSHFCAGEVSFIVTDGRTLPGHGAEWAKRCSTPGLCGMYAERKGLNPEDVDGIQVFDAVGRNDPDALEALTQFTKEIAVQIFNLQMILDPEVFAIGGGISAQPAFIDYIRKNLDALYNQFEEKVPRAKVARCKFQNDANLYGALQTYLMAQNK